MPCDTFNLSRLEAESRAKALRELDEGIANGSLFVHPDPIARTIKIVDESGAEVEYVSTDGSEWSDSCIVEELHHHGSPTTRAAVEKAAEEAHVTVSHHA